MSDDFAFPEPDGFKLRFSTDEKIEMYQAEVDEILVLIGYPEAFVTDMCTVSDFFIYLKDQPDTEFLECQDKLEKLTDKVIAPSYLWKYAAALREKRQ